MYIESYQSKDHHVYGDYCIMMDGDGKKVPAPEEATLTLKQDADGYNYYTYIIGENGTGKSSLIRSIICHEIKVIGGAWNVLADGGADYIRYTPKHITGNEPHFDQIIHICNKPFLQNREISDIYHEYVTMRNDALFALLSFLKKKPNEKPKLAKLIGHPKAKWRLNVLLLPSRMYNYEGGTMTNQPQTAARIEYLFRLLNASSKDMENPPSELYNYYDQIRQQPHFPIMEIKGWEDFKRRVESSSLYRPFMNCVMNMKMGISQPNYNGRDLQSWLTVSNCLGKLNENDLLLLPLFSDMQLLSVNLYCDDVLVDSMSSGEQMMMQLYSYLSTIEKDKLDNVLIVIDEPETSLHPMWQQQFPAILRNLIENVYGIQNSQIIVVTHSPFIIKDAAKLGDDVSVLRFEKADDEFSSRKIADVSLFNIEQLILDEFNVTYRSQIELSDAMGKTRKKSEKDPIRVVLDTDELKMRIERLFNELVI